MSTQNQVAFVLKQLFAAYPNNKATEGTVAVYVRSFQNINIPADELQAVVEQCILECTFLPTVAELHARWKAITRDANRLTASDAWGMVQRQIIQTGHWGKPEFSDAVVAKVVGMLGWEQLCMSENTVADRAHFMKMYNETIEQEERQQNLIPAARRLAESNGAKLGGNPPGIPGGKSLGDSLRNMGLTG